MAINEISVVNNKIVNQKRMKLKTIIPIIIVLISFQSVIAQRTELYKAPYAAYLRASDLFVKEKYGPAQKSFLNIIETIEDKNSEMRINAEYYTAVCAIELFNNDAEHLMKKFIEEHPENLKVRFAYYQLGRHLYYKRRYSEAVEWFDKVDVYDLSDKEKHEYYFKLGYSSFKLDNIEKAKKAFYEIVNIPNKYFIPANYYYAHIAYTEGNYETALTGFQKVSNDKAFGAIAPYYITQIYYYQKKYNKLLEYAPDFVEKATTKRAPEIAKITGIAYYEQGKYAEAVPFLEKFQKNYRGSVTREDHYQLGFAHYMAKEYEKAIPAFEHITGEQDSLAQNAYYHLADCYLKADKKQFAMNTFYQAYKMDFNPEIKENALFNYAKLSYELAFDPYNGAIAAFQEYLNTYPNSKKADEARHYLVNLYLNTKNFKAALASIEQINDKDLKIKGAYQKITYYRGVEYFIASNYDSAMVMFDKSLQYKEDESITARTLYWKGEAYYRQDKYGEAKNFYKAFLLSPGAFSLPLYYKAHYNIGYAFFKKKKYEDAIISFRKYLNNKDNEKPKMVADSYLRLGDSYFISKKYADAIDYYSEAYKIKALDADYALFQRAVAYGVLSNFSSKILSLQQLLKEFPNSAYTDDAKYELANTYMIQDKNEEALQHFNQVVANYPLSSYAKKSLLKIGLIHYNQDKNNQALKSLKKVVNDFPGTAESKEALQTIENIYIAINKAEEFFDYAKTIPFANVSNKDQDSITYIAIENRFMEGDCQSALVGFGNYIDKFANGVFLLNAHYYRAECLKQSNKYNEAIKDYEYVVRQPQSKFTENALLSAANIHYHQKNFSKALEYYQQLARSAEYPKNITKAEIGIMRSNYKLLKFEDAIVSADQVLENEKIEAEIKNESYLIKGISAMKSNDIAKAQTALKKTAKQSQGIYGAQANYYLAKLYFDQEQYEDAQSYIFKVIDNYSAYNYWFAKSFILLADYYEKTGNKFQAKQTLQSIIDNYDGDELLETAHQKLNKLRIKKKLRKKKKKKELRLSLKMKARKQHPMFLKNFNQEE